MDKDGILDRLDMLVQLCKDTEPDVDKMNNNKINSIFSSQLIDSLEMYKTTQSEYEYNDHFDMADVMKKANSIWKLRKKWEEFQKDGKDFSIFTEEQEMMEEVEDCLANGQKINAIKIYRDKMREIYGTKLGLKECKQYIDTLQDDLKKKGVIK